MKECKKCGNEFEPVEGLVNYCSLKCRNSRTWTEEDKEKKSLSARNSIKVKDAIKKANETNKDPEKWVLIKEKRDNKVKENILNSNYLELSFERLRKRILYEQDCKCNRCGISEWLGEKISLELEHKDGNHHNNNRENLEILCPNCHSLTTTWRGRNKKSDNRLKIDDETLLGKLILNEWNMRKSLIDVGLAPKGGNYKRCHKLKREFLDV